jgi:DNA-binding GntR family transcriptional regulator
LDVSRGALREALRTLQEEGLVEARHNHGRYISQISIKDMDEIYSLRVILESFAVRIFTEQAKDEEIDILQGMVDETIRAAQDGDYKQANEYDLNWHKKIWELSHHGRLYQFLSSMQSQIRIFLTINSHLYENVVDGVVFHRDIMDAIAARDGELAAKLMEEHIEEAVETLQKFVHIQAE